jgi:hypothetical protein
MLDQSQLSKLRFQMTEVPMAGGPRGDYEEKCAQWCLERVFFRDFVYRNPRGAKKGQELADAVVLFDDVVLMLQVKAQCGRHDPMSWATEKLLEGFRQLVRTHDALARGRIKTLTNDFYGVMPFDPCAYPNFFGIIVLAHHSDPYVAAQLVPEIRNAAFPVHVFSLKDFELIGSRFDTAGDLITFLELRGDVPTTGYLVQDEAGNIERMVPHVMDVLRSRRPQTTEDVGGGPHLSDHFSPAISYGRARSRVDVRGGRSRPRHSGPGVGAGVASLTLPYPPLQCADDTAAHSGRKAINLGGLGAEPPEPSRLPRWVPAPHAASR